MSTLDTKPLIISEDATEEEFAQSMVQLRKQVKRWQANHKDSLLGKNVSYGIKAACNMTFAGESLGDCINDTVVEKCALDL
ncbi:MAG: hypothetical protein IKA48_00605 [Fibrobacter sp.]|nr:hypothetical protein [Fibrobacter sp.]